ncbi:MAG: hypothetical protein R3D26_09400 [Cyanobacteriota/Melainabacteria group bacterium]
MRQDDREALFSAEATHLASLLSASIEMAPSSFGCTEVLTRHSKNGASGKDGQVREKVTVAGEIFKPYQFDKITYLGGSSRLAYRRRAWLR